MTQPNQHVFASEILNNTNLGKCDLVIYAAQLRRLGYGNNVHETLTKLSEDKFENEDQAIEHYQNLIDELTPTPDPLEIEGQPEITSEG
jgi:hypothetical protein